MEDNICRVGGYSGVECYKYEIDANPLGYHLTTTKVVIMTTQVKRCLGAKLKILNKKFYSIWRCTNKISNSSSL